MSVSSKQEPLFDLIKSMTKAEKRNFKLYATRLQGNQDAKFITLFDCMEAMEEYDEKKILSKCPVKKEQLPNVKAHLYRQVLVSLRLINTLHSEVMQMREQLDFVQILFDKGLYKQCYKLLERVKEQVIENEMYAFALESVDFQMKLDTLHISHDMTSSGDVVNKEVLRLCSEIEHVSNLANISTRAYSLYQKVGYARTQKDLDLIKQYFKPRLEAYEGKVRSFHERFYFYQASAWYYYIQHDFVRCYRYSRMWVELFEANPKMKASMYFSYLKGRQQFLDNLFLMRRYRTFCQNLDAFKTELDEIFCSNMNANIIANRIWYTQLINRAYMNGRFEDALEYVPEIVEYMKNYSSHMSVHTKMIMRYKIACLYFGEGDYRRCMDHLSAIISTKDPEVRRDLQCFARMLNLIASYEAGIDYNLDYQIRSVYAFIVKMNDMQAVQKQLLGFLKKLTSMYAGDLNKELKILYENLKPYEYHPYERRTFYYLDLLSWLESKITGRSVKEIVQNKFGQIER